jgi:hypothetical protein
VRLFSHFVLQKISALPSPESERKTDGLMMSGPANAALSTIGTSISKFGTLKYPCKTWR